jgi:cyclase
VSHHNLIVARLDGAHAPRVAELFAESDRTELPDLVGVTRRTLFTFHDLYFHLVESDGDMSDRLDNVREHPLFRGLNHELAQYVEPYHPGWRGPRDALAVPFYQWHRPGRADA